MESANNILAHPGLSFYPTITSSGILPGSPGGQDSVARSALSSGQNAWGGYANDGIGPHNSCAMSSYSNLQLGPSFSMNSKAAYNTAFGGDYLNSCRQIPQLGGMNSLPMRNYSSLYSEMYNPAHPPTYPNGGFYPEMTPGALPLHARELNCSSGQSDSSVQGKTSDLFCFICLFVAGADSRGVGVGWSFERLGSEPSLNFELSQKFSALLVNKVLFSFKEVYLFYFILI